jgi:hypothetical protein
MDVVDERHARRLQPERREEGDAVDHLEHNVGVRDEPAPLIPDRPREHGRAPAHPVDREIAHLLARLAALVAAGDHRDAMAPGEPAGDLSE